MENINRDLYEVVGVSRNATEQEIREACLRLADRYRPDRNPDDPIAARNFEAIERAFEVLGNPAKRSKYDASRSQVVQPPIPTSGGRGLWLLVGSIAAVIVAFVGWYALSGDSAPKGDGIAQKIASLTKPKPGKLAIQAYQALKKLEAATESGLTASDYGTRLADTWYAVKTFTESTEAKPQPELVQAMMLAIVAYNKAALVWKVQISERDADEKFVPEVRVPYWAKKLKEDLPDLDRFLFPTYAFQSDDPRERQYRLKEAVSGYWGDASKALKEIDSAMR